MMPMTNEHYSHTVPSMSVLGTHAAGMAGNGGMMMTPGFKGTVVIRYFTTITPKDEGSVVRWTDAPSVFSGIQLRNALVRKGIPLSSHHPQVYNKQYRGYENLDEDAVFRMPPDGTVMRLDLRLTPLVGPNGAVGEQAKGPAQLQLPPRANGGPIALFAFGFTTLLLMLVETKIATGDTILLICGYAWFHGGLVQLLIGLYELSRNNLFGAVAFVSYGAFWMGWALTETLVKTGDFAGTAYPAGKSGYLAIWGIFTTMMFVQTLFINLALQAIFGLLALCFFLLSAGVYSPDSIVAGGIVGIILCIVVFYTATAELYNELGSVRLPLFPVAKHDEEHNNCKPGKGAVLRWSDPAGVLSLRARQGEMDPLALPV
mmetsp:Transcript_23446/g.57865  ORF Transcript_23446/g.57865 Transcript_23446/m.57865 type:complete len:373 (+) Transcript_23446:170-1288(+)|eukprot:CAMPEP_0206227986 /NCGR_PEP_ID=MMETSP0047_2-20121206/8922_1 /ASSEMBLY_ACC=CAM_ASM_000192 /TAXON_ID=195065 /ORGANISM="Chroomonas mesostigmatica_cf, Strain CCMP1168" /LENGTH=372 /DNA_ID=CAMNT_0053651187 /DNA_START=167 /DNA_END=1285 /DNA_ORIENTATION=-